MLANEPQWIYMYTLSQLLIRNFIFALSFTALIALVSTVFLTIQINDLQEKHQQTLQSYNQKKNSAENIVNMINQISTLNHYQSLKLKEAGKVIVNITQNSPSPISTIILAQASRVKLSTYDIELTFQLNVERDVTMLLRILSTTFILSIIFGIIASSLSIGRYKKLTNNISKQISNDLNLILSDDNSSNETHNRDIELPEIQQCIEALKTLIKNKALKTNTLEQNAYIEPVTKLENRNRFIQFFENADKRSDFGVLSITRCSELQTINQIHGYHEGDTYIRAVADIMKEAITRYKGAQVFRLNSSDFATLIPNITLKSSEEFAKDLTARFNQHQCASDLDSVGYTGLVYFDKNKPLGELLALADTGISIAQTQSVNAWFAQTDTSILENSSASYGNQNWRQEIDSVIENHRINLLIQAIKPSIPNNRVYGEVLARFVNSNNDVLPTASFFAMAEKLDKIVEVDRMIIETAIKEITEKNMQDHYFGINISARSINDGHFLIWLERRLLRDTAIASKLVFEIAESGLQQNIKTSKHFVDMIHRVGARVTVERFGVGLTSFKFFRDLKPDFIKMDSTYTRDIDEDKNNQYFLRLMVDLAHRLSISVLAESVESQEEKFTLEKLFIDGCQGFYIGKPKPL